MQIINVEAKVVTPESNRARRTVAGSGVKAGCSLCSYRLFKGIIDKIFALVTLVVISPFLGIIAMAIKLDSPGRAIFRREQVGEKGKHFTAYKFRTMYENNDDSAYRKYVAEYILENKPYAVTAEGKPVYKVVNDPRVTKIGSILRKTNLDELPQLVNIIKGEMSWIGPRPDIPLAVSIYQPRHMKRFDIKPGLSGLWQVSGRKDLNFEDMVRLDIEYIQKQSMLLDIKIAFLTLVTILKRDGS